MLRPAYRAATWVFVVVMLASSFAAILGVAQAATTNYTLTGYVDQPGLSAPPVPAGVVVDLVSRATGTVYTSVVAGSGGQFTFTSSGTSGALAPGYWSLSVPPAANTTLSGCKPCAVLPLALTTSFRFYNATQLTNSSYSTSVTGVQILPYNATLTGTVTQGASTVQGASVELLSPTYGGLVLVSNVTNSSGGFSLKVPFGSWVLQVLHTSGPDVFSNTSAITIASRTPAPVSPVLKSFEVSGHVVSALNGLPVPTTGNATLFDPTNGYVYTAPTAVGGYYSFATYLGNFVSGSQTFDVVAASSGYEPGWFSQTVSAPSFVTHNISVPLLAHSSLGVFATRIDLSGINVATGKGSIAVTTNATLGNDSILPGLPNGTVGQLWAQLGLDFNRSLSFPASDFPALRSWVNASGPFFPAVQALTTLNGTGFVGPRTPQSLGSFTAPTCSPCGLSSSGALAFGWSTSYALNGTIPRNGSSYTLSFRFAHPSTTADVYNYTISLPSGYVLSAGTNAPAHTKLVGSGPNGTWTNFTLVSMASSTAGATASFNLVRAANLTAIVNISAKSFTFTHKNVLNSTRGNYTVVLGVNETATFSAANSSFPAGTNGTSFTWNFGDNTTTTVSNLTTNHTYARANGSGSWDGSLTIVSSGGHRNTTRFFVTIVSSSPTAKITTNASSIKGAQVHTGFVFLPWNSTLQINAVGSGAPAPNNLSDAVFKLTAKNYNASRNNSAAQGISPYANWSVAFGGGSKPGAGQYVNFANQTVGGNPTGLTGYGWRYNLTLVVYSYVGTSANASLVVLVNDTQKPSPSILLQGSSGNAIPSTGIVEQPNGFATVRLNASGSADPGNGSVVSFRWVITLKGNSTPVYTNSSTKVKPYGALPTASLPPSNKTYRINLTVTDRNGNKANVSKTLLVSKNSTLRPIMEASNLTGPSTVNVGQKYTYWVNVTVGGGASSFADNVTVTFYLRGSSGTGSKTDIAGSPSSVVFYGYSNDTPNATVNSTPITTTTPGVLANLSHGKTVRAVVSWSPSSSGSFILYANVSAENEFAGDFGSTNIASTPVTVHPNPTTQYLEYGGIAAAVVVVLGLLIFYYRRRTRRPGTPSRPSGSGRGGLERGRTDEEDDES